MVKRKIASKQRKPAVAKSGPAYDPEEPNTVFQRAPDESSQSPEGSIDLNPGSPPVEEDSDLPPSRIATPPPFVPRSDDDVQSDTGSDDGSILGLSQPEATGADIPRRIEEPRMGDYFQKRRDLLNILKSLHNTGIQNELDLPQIVVIGSQSVGKSSLIESMSG
ncbi:hypothetical protein FRC00_008776, partial [Tulasnella sp. 408]